MIRRRNAQVETRRDENAVQVVGPGRGVRGDENAVQVVGPGRGVRGELRGHDVARVLPGGCHNPHVERVATQAHVIPKQRVIAPEPVYHSPIKGRTFYVSPDDSSCWRWLKKIFRALVSFFCCRSC